MRYDSERFVTAQDGTRLYVGIAGSGPALVLNDGIGCDGFAWKYLGPHLAATHRVIHWHYRGHGRSGAPVDASKIHMAALAEDLVTVLDAVGEEQAVLMGHSMGTQVALEGYRLAPDRVRSMVLLCGSYGRVTRTFHGSAVLENVLPTLIEAVQKHRGLARALWGRMPAGLAFRLARMSREIDALAIREEDFRRYMEHVALVDPDLFLNMLRHAGEHSAEDLLPSITAPTLVIAAERDTFTPPSLAEHMAGQIPGAGLLILPGASHAAPIEQPRVIAARIDAFLAGIPAVSSAPA